jgi:GNAT superfamily N-acetyltransferase
VLAMALAEPGRTQDGAGAVVPGYGHVSMVFVHPDMWGRGLGAAAARTPRACLGQRLGPYDVVDPGIERSRSSPLRRLGIPNLGPPEHPW